MDTTTNETGRECIGPDPHAGLILLQVAPRVNHRIRFSALSNSTPKAVLPTAAVEIARELISIGSKADAVLLYGPGDPLSDIDLTLETITLLKKKYPDLKLLIRTLGIGGLQHADKLQKAGVSEVEILVDGMDPAVLEKIYAWIRPGFKTLKLSESAKILHDEQSQAIQAFKDAGVFVRIVTTLYPTANDDHLLLLAKRVADLGADELMLHPYSPEADADIVLPAPDTATITALVNEIGEILPARQGRPAALQASEKCAAQTQLPKPKKERPNIAVVSSNGMDIDLHLGQAPQLLVYGPRDDGLQCLLECRPAPAPGAGKERWDILASKIPDCFALLTASAGERPQRILDSHGIQVVITQENIEGTVDKLYGGGKKSCGKNPAS